MKKMIKILSPAKLNLCLEVVNRYDSGFHELRSIFLKSKNIYDELFIVFDESKHGISIDCTNEIIPRDDKNICWKIIDKYFEKTKFKRIGVEIDIKKNIPILAGLGGGSSNGASVLLAINEYFGSFLTLSELTDIAEEIGKDIPFFLNNHDACYVSGVGENVQGIDGFMHLNILVIYPNEHISTSWAYGKLDRDLWYMKNKFRYNLSEEIVRNSKDFDRLIPNIHNDFLVVTGKKIPVVTELISTLKAFGAKASSISGKGPTVFGVFKDENELNLAEGQFRENYPDYFISKF